MTPRRLAEGLASPRRRCSECRRVPETTERESALASVAVGRTRREADAELRPVPLVYWLLQRQRGLTLSLTHLKGPRGPTGNGEGQGLKRTRRKGARSHDKASFPSWTLPPKTLQRFIPCAWNIKETRDQGVQTQNLVRCGYKRDEERRESE